MRYLNIIPFGTKYGCCHFAERRFKCYEIRILNARRDVLLKNGFLKFKVRVVLFISSSATQSQQIQRRGTKAAQL